MITDISELNPVIQFFSEWVEDDFVDGIEGHWVQIDAFTGEPLDMSDCGFAFIIPEIIRKVDDFVHNLIPCNKNTIPLEDYNEAFYPLSWYQKQDFFDPERFLKIMEWAGQSKELAYFNKYKYVPLNQLKYIDTFDTNTSIQNYTIFGIDRNKIHLKYSNKINKQAFGEHVYNVAIKPYESQLIKEWENHDKGIYSSARFLDRCADFILQGELNYERMMHYQKHEITEADLDQYEEPRSDFEAELFDDRNKREIKRAKKRVSKLRKKDTTYNKLELLFSKDSYDRLELITLKNKDIFPNSKRDSEWLEKDAENIFGKKIYDMKRITYPGRKGIIDITIPYESEWCYVWADGTFNFCEHTYQIDIGTHTQYTDVSKIQVKNTKGGRPRKHEYWSMDKILCIKQNDKIHFWDMNIEKIKEVHLHEE